MKGKYSPTIVLIHPAFISSSGLGSIIRWEEYPQDLPEIETIRLTRWPDDAPFEEDRGNPGHDEQEEGCGYHRSQPRKPMSFHDADGDGSEQEEAQQRRLWFARGLGETRSASREVRVDGEGDPDGCSEQNEDPLQYVSSS